MPTQCSGPSRGMELNGFTMLLESDAEKELRQNMHDVHLEVCGFVKSLLLSLGGRRVFVVAVGSGPKGTTTAGSDVDCACSCEFFEPHSKRVYSYGLGNCARKFKFKKTFVINSCTLTFNNEHYEKKNEMHLLALDLHYKKGLIEFKCSVDVTERKGFSSVHNTLFVRHYTTSYPDVGELILSIKLRVAARNLSKASKKTLIGYGWELLTLIALIQLKKLPIVDPLAFAVTGEIFESMSYVDDISDFDYTAFSLGNVFWSDLSDLDRPSFSEIEVLRQISDILRERADRQQLVIKFRDADIQPVVPQAALVIVDPCVPSGSSGSNVERAVDHPGLDRIRLGLNLIIAELGKQFQ